MNTITIVFNDESEAREGAARIRKVLEAEGNLSSALLLSSLKKAVDFKLGSKSFMASIHKKTNN